jgi:hypothetical protein
MGILEIILTIFAWRNGWKWLSIIPVCTGFVLGFLLGLSGIAPLQAIWLDVIAIIVLIIMCIKKPNKIESKS